MVAKFGKQVVFFLCSLTFQITQNLLDVGYMYTHNHVSHMYLDHLIHILATLQNQQLLVGLSKDDKHQVWFSAHHSAGIGGTLCRSVVYN